MSACRLLFKRMHYSYKRKFLLIHLTTRSFTNNEILWRSIIRDATTNTTKTYSFSDEYSTTKSLLQQPYDRETMKQTFIQMADAQRQLAPLHIARLAMYLRDLPYDLPKTVSISSLIDMYITCYQELKEIKPISTMSDCDEFYKIFGLCMLHQKMTLPKLCHGLLEKSTDPSNSVFTIESSGQFVTAFIDKFASSRLALRVISAHKVKLYEQIKNDSPVKTGIFEENCDVMKYIKQAVTDSSHDCQQYFSQYINLKNKNFMPNIECIDKRKNTSGSNFVYIPYHLNMMVFELLKNSMRAIIEKNEHNNMDEHGHEDKISIVVVDGNDGSMTIKVSDEGGGISRTLQQEKIWLYGYTTAFGNDMVFNDKRLDLERMIRHRDMFFKIIKTAEEQWQSGYNEQSDDLNALFDASVMGAGKYAPIFGLGYGLPITRLRSRYLGGNVRIQSVNGYGTDAYLFLKNLSDCTATMNI